MTKLKYPKKYDEVDEIAPYTFLYDEYERFQVCHSRLGEDMNFVVLIRVLDSKIDPDGIITLNGFELMVVSFFIKKSVKLVALDTSDIINKPPVEIVYSEQDEAHHGPIINFNVRVKIIENIPDADLPVYYYARPVKIDPKYGERLHFVMQSDEAIINLESGVSKGRMCLTVINGKSVYRPYQG